MDIWPDLGLGLWNAWPLMLLYALAPVLSGVLLKDRMRGLNKIGIGGPLERVTTAIWMGAMFGGLAYSTLVPLRLGTVWLYAGLGIYAAGHLVFLAALRGIAAAPPGGVFTTGAYRHSRHPLYIGHALIYLGVGVACLSPVFVALAAVVFGVASVWAPHEERSCLERHGEAYRAYMERTPRWLGPPRR